ncbi:hypothetical protein INS49_008924 [Diaporthe citri]|uniref:uncharacterized protein n=1 Tax=Diaporthe citri TaxID=83186 RepID=UPI001C7E3D5D|nr:uncharacterized protein INS49_008924 [Diaporthe citri]KAG6363821.1 hypothetical protein INS49_008924 [Diaporthe citri]
MQTVPSLVGTGTVAAAAAAGLVFGQSTESPTPSSPRPSSPLKRKLFSDFSFDNPRSTPTPPPLSPPGTSSARFPQLVEDDRIDQQQHPSPLTSNPVNISPTTGSQTTPPKSSSRRLSTIRATEVAAATDQGRESISSHGSWMRRLSLRPPSQHGSLRSIAEPDSAFSYSQGSGPSMLSPTGSVAPQLPTPNKLVKRPGTESIFARRGSRIQVPTLRRPATSTRIHLRRGSLLPAPYLVNPAVITGDPYMMAPVERELESALPAKSATLPRQSPQNSKESTNALERTPTKGSRRSLSAQFGASGGWIARAGSLRRPKRKSLDHVGGRRYASDPVSTSPKASRSNGAKSDMEALFTPPLSGHKETQNTANSASQEQKRDAMASIPPLSRLSSFHLDLSKMGPSPPHSAGLQAPSPIQISPTTAPQGAPFSSHSRAVSKEGASTLAGSEMSVPGLASGDDDDTDYKSDAVFDSFRTNDSNRVRVVETPLDSMFDESPLGTLGNVKAKRLSIQEILGNNWDGDTRIMEEDEGSSTPIRGIHGPHIADDTDDADDRATEIAKFQISIGNNARNFGRLSLDTTDDDYDWARDDEDVLSNPLSPPTSSVNSRRGVSPQLRSALANISGNATPDSYTTGVTTERPRSNVFDWSEPFHEKTDDSFTRPRTVHGKRELDLRGGRTAVRPSAHVRSQSVPVVEPVDIVKGAPKFGTWGLSAKNASEDWDDDFEFDEGSTSDSAPKNHVQPLSMSVPPSIQTAQATVKAHSGHIRELSLLVDSLKRLCRQGRELNLLNGQSALLWKEAENIIALASPDEDEVDDNEADRDSSDSEPYPLDDRFLDGGFDAASLDRADAPVEAHEPDIPKNAVIRERQVVRRRSVFSPDDDIFGNTWSLEKESTRPHTPRTPDRVREFHTPDGAVVSSVIAAMEQQRSLPGRRQESPLKPSKAKLFFDTNSLHELVRRASSVFHTLSDIVRKEELLSMSPQATPTKLDRIRPGHGGSPAFTRVFTDPDTSPPRHLVRSQKSHSPLPRNSLDSGLNQRMQMMTVS